MNLRRLKLVAVFFCGGTENYLAYSNWPGLLDFPVWIGRSWNDNLTSPRRNRPRNVLLDCLWTDDRSASFRTHSTNNSQDFCGSDAGLQRRTGKQGGSSRSPAARGLQ